MKVSVLEPKDSILIDLTARALHGCFYKTSKSLDQVRRKISDLVAAASLSLVLVATDQDDALLGTLTILKSHSSDDTVVAGDLYVDKDRRRDGVATLLAGHGIVMSKGRLKADRIIAQVAHDAPSWLVEFYEGLGFLSMGSHQYVLHI